MRWHFIGKNLIRSQKQLLFFIKTNAKFLFIFFKEQSNMSKVNFILFNFITPNLLNFINSGKSLLFLAAEDMYFKNDYLNKFQLNLKKCITL